MTGIYQGLTLVDILFGTIRGSRKDYPKSIFGRLQKQTSFWKYLAICQLRSLMTGPNALSSAAEEQKILLQNAEADYVLQSILNNQPIKLK